MNENKNEKKMFEKKFRENNVTKLFIYIGSMEWRNERTSKKINIEIYKTSVSPDSLFWCASTIL